MKNLMQQIKYELKNSKGVVGKTVVYHEENTAGEILVFDNGKVLYVGYFGDKIESPHWDNISGLKLGLKISQESIIPPYKFEDELKQEQQKLKPLLFEEAISVFDKYKKSKKELSDKVDEGK